MLGYVDNKCGHVSIALLGIVCTLSLAGCWREEVFKVVAHVLGIPGVLVCVLFVCQRCMGLSTSDWRVCEFSICLHMRI